MAQNRLLELIVGLFILIGIAALFLLTFQVSTAQDILPDKGYKVTAKFENIGSLKVRAPISLAGVNIGRVTDIHIDPRSFQAVVTLSISKRYEILPRDSDASIQTAGLLGEQYIGISPGGADEMLREGDEIQFTQSALVLEKLIGQFATGIGNK